MEKKSTMSKTKLSNKVPSNKTLPRCQPSNVTRQSTKINNDRYPRNGCGFSEQPSSVCRLDTSINRLEEIPRVRSPRHEKHAEQTNSNNSPEICYRNHIPTIISVRRKRKYCRSTMKTNIAHNCIKIKINQPSESTSVPSFFLSNVCHITNKVDELTAVVSIDDPSVVMVTESWLSAEVPDLSVKVGDKYNMFRHDRHSPGGGVIAYVNKSLSVERMVDLEEENKEVIWLLLKPHRTPRPYSAIIVAVVYYPPGQTAQQAAEMNEYLTNCIDSLQHERPSSWIVITSDFNQLKLNRLCNRFNLRKCVTKPTRGRNILDQILTNMVNLFDTVCHLPPIGRSDHQCLFIKPVKRQENPSMSKKIRVMKTANLNNLSLKMATEDWNAVYSAQDIDQKVQVFNSILLIKRNGINLCMFW